MKPTIHFYIRTDRPSKNGSVPIYLKFSISRTQRVKLSTGKYIALKKEFIKLPIERINALSDEERDSIYCWDKTKERAIKGDPNWEHINEYLDGEKFRANQVLSKFEQLNRPITLETFKQAYLKPNATDKFKEYFLDELENRKAQLSEGTYRGIKGQISKIDKFKPNLTIGDIDYKFLTLFENHMLKPVSEKGLGNLRCSVARTMKVIRSLLQIAIKNGDFPESAYPFKHYKIKQSESVLTTRDYLEPEDLYKVEQLLAPQNISELTIGEIKATKRLSLIHI